MERLSSDRVSGNDGDGGLRHERELYPASEPDDQFATLTGRRGETELGPRGGSHAAQTTGRRLGSAEQVAFGSIKGRPCSSSPVFGRGGPAAGRSRKPQTCRQIEAAGGCL